MASFSISKDNFTNFLSGFGNDLADIAIRVSSGGISASVGKTTHYISRAMDCGTVGTGFVYITDLPKLKSFLGAAKVASLDISQEGKTGTLHVRGGSVNLQLPTSSYIESQQRVGMMEKAINTSRDSMWRSWFHTPLTHHARVMSEALKPVTGFKRVLGGKYACKTEFDVDGAEFILMGGKKETGKMFVRAGLSQVEAPSIAARSAFGQWLPELLNSLPAGEFELHTGDGTVLILEQADTQFLMVVIDQEYEED